MKCVEVRTRMPLLLSDEMEAAHVVAMLQHLNMCAQCSEHARNEERIRARLVAALGSEALPASVQAGLTALLAAPATRVQRWWPWAGAAAAILLWCLPFFEQQPRPASDPQIPETPTVGTTFWGPDGVQQSERTPLVDLARLETLATTERTLDGAALAVFYAGLTDIERPQGWYRLFTPAAQRNSPVTEARVPADRSRIFTLTLGTAMELGLDVATDGVLGGARVLGDTAAQVVVIRDGDQCHVLVTSGRLRSLAFMLHLAARSSSN